MIMGKEYPISMPMSTRATGSAVKAATAAPAIDDARSCFNRKRHSRTAKINDNLARIIEMSMMDSNDSFKG
jgi:hypothetical protein